jgi:membrane-associated phospholipid phosphatase
MLKLTIVLLLLPAPLWAQPIAVDKVLPKFSTEDARRGADIASWATVSLAVALDTKASWDTSDRQRAFALQGARIGVTVIASELLKRWTHRTRPCAMDTTAWYTSSNNFAPPCGSDAPDKSFPSMHTALAFQTVGGPRLAFSLPLAISTGGLRVLAGKHWLTDTLVGAGIGLATSRIR